MTPDVLAAMEAEAGYLETIGNPRAAQVREAIAALAAAAPAVVEEPDDDVDAVTSDELPAKGRGRREQAVKPPSEDTSV